MLNYVGLEIEFKHILQVLAYSVSYHYVDNLDFPYIDYLEHIDELDVSVIYQ